MRRFWDTTGTTLVRYARRGIVAIVGGTVVFLGVVMLVTPGPAFIVIPAGIAILAIEFAWARRLLRRLKEEGPSGVSRRFRRLLREYRPPWRRNRSSRSPAPAVEKER